MQRALLLQSSPVLEADDFDLAEDMASNTNAAELSLLDIQAALDEHGGVVARAARHLGISRQALYRRLAKAEKSAG